MTDWSHLSTLRTVSTWHVADVEALAGVRQALEAAVREHAPGLDAPGSDEPLSHVVLVASELISNALRHADSPARLDLLVAGSTVVVSVLDHRPDAPPVLSPDRDPGQGGFGLQLAMRVAADVGWYRSSEDCKRVWARFTVPLEVPAEDGGDTTPAGSGTDAASASPDSPVVVDARG